MSDHSHPSRSPLRVILAEASASVREGLRQVLSELPDVVVVAEAASRAELATVLRTTPVEVLLLDVDLSHGDLGNCLLACQGLRPGIRVVAMSELRSPALDLHCYAAGVDAVLSKTGRLETLARTLARFASQAPPVAAAPLPLL